MNSSKPSFAHRLAASCLLAIFVGQMTFADGGESTHGANAVTDGSQGTLLDFLEYDYTAFEPAPGILSLVEAKMALFETKVGVKACSFKELTWVETDRDLEVIHDQGAQHYYVSLSQALASKLKDYKTRRDGERVKLTPPSKAKAAKKDKSPETWRLQLAAQKNGLVVLSRNGMEVLSNEKDPFGRPLDAGTIIHELLICTAVKENLDILTYDEGTDPLRQLNALLILEGAQNFPDRTFKAIWARLPKNPDPTKEGDGFTFNLITDNGDATRGDESVTITLPRVKINGEFYPVGLANPGANHEELNAVCAYFKKGRAVGSRVHGWGFMQNPSSARVYLHPVSDDDFTTKDPTQGGLIQQIRLPGGGDYPSEQEVDAVICLKK